MTHEQVYKAHARLVKLYWIERNGNVPNFSERHWARMAELEARVGSDALMLAREDYDQRVSGACEAAAWSTEQEPYQ